MGGPNRFLALAVNLIQSGKLGSLVSLLSPYNGDDVDAALETTTAVISFWSVRYRSCCIDPALAFAHRDSCGEFQRAPVRW